MSFAEEAARMNDTVFETFGVPGAYTPKGGTAKPGVLMIIDYGTSDGTKGTDEFNTDATGQVRVSEIELAQEGDEITIGSEQWIVDFGKLIDDGQNWQVWMSRVTR